MIKEMYFASQPEGVETDCPVCGSPPIVNDSGLNCSNPQCPNHAQFIASSFCECRYLCYSLQKLDAKYANDIRNNIKII